MKPAPNGRHIDADGNPVELLCRKHDCHKQHMILSEDFFVFGDYLTVAEDEEKGYMTAIAGVALVIATTAVAIAVITVIVRSLL